MGTSRLEALKVKLPSKKNKYEPDFEYMEDFIKTLSYSSELKKYQQ